MKMNPGRFDYQLYFQDEGIAEAELGGNVQRTMNLMLRTSKPEDKLDVIGMTSGVAERGGLLVGLPRRRRALDHVDRGRLADVRRRVPADRIPGGLNWYRNHGRNWEWDAAVDGNNIEQPALDGHRRQGRRPVAVMSEGMEDWIPNLSRGHIEDCVTGLSRKSRRNSTHPRRLAAAL